MESCPAPRLMSRTPAQVREAHKERRGCHMWGGGSFLSWFEGFKSREAPDEGAGRPPNRGDDWGWPKGGSPTVQPPHKSPNLLAAPPSRGAPTRL